MATKIESEPPQNYESGAEDGVDDEADKEEATDQEEVDDQEDADDLGEEEELRKPVNNNVANILARLQSSGALIRKPKQENHCFTCKEDFNNWEDLEHHLIQQHVSIPSIILEKLPSDDEETPPSGDENWSDEDEREVPPPKTPKKVDISQIMKNSGLSIKKSNDSNNPTSALNKLSGLGFTIKKNTTPIKKENNEDDPDKSNVIKKLGNLGGIKLKLKSDGSNTNTFKVVNGLKDFRTSDEEDVDSDRDEEKEQDEDDKDDGDEQSGSEDISQNKSNSRKPSESDCSDDSSISKINRSIPKLPQGIVLKPKNNAGSRAKTPVKTKPGNVKEENCTIERPVIKQIPKRISNHATPRQSRESPKITELPSSRKNSESSTPERRVSHETPTENVTIKKEVEDSSATTASVAPLFSNQIKTERTSPPLPDSSSTPILATIKTEVDAPPTQTTVSAATTTPLLPVTKVENAPMAIIEINGDSNDEDDDDCCVVSTTPAPDIKPKIEEIVPKIETVPIPTYTSTQSYSTPTFSTSSSNYSSAQSVTSSRFSSMPSTEKQHNFNWNAPDSKPITDHLYEKSADEIFESLLSSSSKKENLMSDVSEYISLDKLGPQHSCEVCNTRFTDISLLEDHRRMTGHSQSLIPHSNPTSTLLPYTPSSNILSSLLPVKQLAEQVGKLSNIGSGPGYTHQQNVMINIQAYPGTATGGVMMPPQAPYNNYQGQNMHGNYSQPGMYPNMSSQYQGGANYMGSGMPNYPNQYQQPPNSPYSSTMPPSSYPSAPAYSTPSPLQSMQQSVYGQSSTGMMNQPGTMGLPGASPNQQYPPVSSPAGLMKPPGNIKIQNVQTFPAGQVVGQPGKDSGPMNTTGQPPASQMHPPTQIRMASGVSPSGPRPRMPSIRGQRPTIRPGTQIQGQVRGKIGARMPIKRPGGPTQGPGLKRRPDMLLPGKHDNEDCQVMAMQKQRDGLPMIQSVQGAKDKLGSQISVTKKPVNKMANAMANVLASRGISIMQKQKSRTPSPERPLPHLPNLGSGVSIKHTSKSSNFSIPETKVGGGMLSCKYCKKMFMNQSSLQAHITNAHPQSKVPIFKCDECPASYPKSLQLQHHKRVFHNVSGANRELGLPVVDLSQTDNLKRLSNLGIYSFIPLANREQANGCFGIPVLSVHNMQGGLTSSLQALGADGLLSLGPLKALPNS
ncbi:uncharacterized protein LOC126969975 [Leptidea sinapis]|uniref:uncharacterized protein LOC126969975 n=1 Tax=Leptidea sinapis TaxID=189913 RepID=UPI0021C32D67|nr:uncharacterized protein LOC126969975 [Leptidea sinapis]